jgi:DNA primase
MIIDDHIKEQIRQAADIVEVIGRYVELKKRGSNYMGLSPFKQEKTPSFSVSPKLNIFKDFSSGVGGDVFKFLMEIEGWSFVQAAKHLAEMYHVALPTENAAEQEAYQQKNAEREGVLHALDFAANFYTQRLFEDAEAEIARAYVRNRKIKKKALNQFRLGYAPKSGQGLIQAAEMAKINPEYLLKAGLIKESDRNGEGGFYDFFRGRLIFPIFDANGRIIAFAGRILGQAKGPKYINSAETLVYHKSDVLYGMHTARHEIRKHKECILVEGYTDVISLWQEGVEHAVASSGTALTEGQLKLIGRYADRLCMIYDGDEAGQNAMIRAIEIAFKVGIAVQILELPDQEDPDSYVQQYGADTFLAFKQEHQIDFIQYYINRAKLTGKWASPQGQSQTIAQILEILSTIEDELTKVTSINSLAALSGVGTKLLEERLVLIKQQKLEEQQKREAYQKYRRNAEQAQQGPANVLDEAENIPLPDESYLFGDADETSAPLEAISPFKQSIPAAEKELLRLLMTYGRPLAEYVFTYMEAGYFSEELSRALFEQIHANFKAEKAFNDVVMIDFDQFAPLIEEIFTEKDKPSVKHPAKIGVERKRDKEPFNNARSTMRIIALRYLDRKMKALQAAFEQTTVEEERRALLNQRQVLFRQKTDIEKLPLSALFAIPEHLRASSDQQAFSYSPKKIKIE